MTSAPPIRASDFVAFAVIAAGLVLLCVSAALAAETERWEIIRYARGADYEKFDRAHAGLGNETYASRTECEIAIVRVKVMTSGVRLQCERKMPR